MKRLVSCPHCSSAGHRRCCDVVAGACCIVVAVAFVVASGPAFVVVGVPSDQQRY